MVAAGHDVHMVTSYRGDDKFGRDWLQSVEAGINVHWLPVPYSNHMNYLQRIKAFIRFAFAARRKAIALKGDVIFATSTPLTIAIPAVFAARKNKIPMVFEVRDLWPEMPIAMGALKHPLLKYAARRLEKWAYFNSAAVVALSPGMKRGVTDTGYPRSNVAVIPNSSDNSEFKIDLEMAREFRQKRPWLGGAPFLVYAGTFGRVNDVSYMVKLAAELKRIDSDIKILLVGDGQERYKILELAQEVSVYGYNLFFEEMIPKKEIPALLGASAMASSLFIDIVEMQVNSANKFFDTLAAGRPILLNYGGWMHALVEKNNCGLAVRGKPVSEVAATLDNVLHDDSWLRDAGLRARRLAESYFDRDKLADQLIAVLERAALGEQHDFSAIAPITYL